MFKTYINSYDGFIFFNYRFDNKLSANKHINLGKAGDFFRKTLDNLRWNEHYVIANDEHNPIFKNRERRLRFYTTHSLRKTHSDLLQEVSNNPFIASNSLNHSDVGTTLKHYSANRKRVKKSPRRSV